MIQIIYKITGPLEVNRLDDHLKAAWLSRQFVSHACANNLRFDSRRSETVGNHRRDILGRHRSNHHRSVWVFYAHSPITVRVSWISYFIGWPSCTAVYGTLTLPVKSERDSASPCPVS